ncbi:MAG: hypothetical protein P1U35_02050 [Cycloclasticus sp.]|nr:hypothetical protein [Cycloclasticus sp.]
MSHVSNNKIPYGLKNGRLIHVSCVESGLACGCVCPSCKRKLQANKGKIVSHYFSHDPSAEIKSCESAFETSIHLMAKQILSEDGYSMMPGLTLSDSMLDANGHSHTESLLLESEQRTVFDRVELEKRLDEIRPDIIAYIDGQPLLIEVAVTSFVKPKKKQIIRELGLPAIEIDLSTVGYATPEDELRKLLNASSGNKKWLSNPKAIRAKEQLNTTLKEKIQLINQGIYKARNKRYVPNKKPPRPKPMKASPYLRKPSEVANHSGSRWFLCEACRHQFEVLLQNVVPSSETIPCPSCEHAVSTKSCRSY